MNLLLVENHEIFAKTAVKEFLSDRDVEIVPSVNSALSKFKQEDFDVVLVDYDLDDGKGSEFVVKLRKFDATVPIVAVSSHFEGNNESR